MQWHKLEARLDGRPQQRHTRRRDGIPLAMGHDTCCKQAAAASECVCVAVNCKQFTKSVEEIDCEKRNHFHIESRCYLAAIP